MKTSTIYNAAELITNEKAWIKLRESIKEILDFGNQPMENVRAIVMNVMQYEKLNHIPKEEINKTVEEAISEFKCHARDMKI